MDIEWKEGAVCFAGSSQWFASCKDNKLTSKCGSYGGSLDECISSYNYQLNTIKQGDYIEASELDTEQKYNDAVEVFGLFGFTPYERKAKEALRLVNEIFFASDDLLFIGALEDCEEAKRKITFTQLMAIGELNRLEIEKSAPKIAPDLTPGLGIASSNKYERDITDRQGNSATVDVYDVLKAFEVTCPATQHALKKLLCSGLRGHKDLQTDLLEAKESITRAIELND